MRFAIFLLLIVVSPALADQPSAADREFFEKRVRPLLSEHCLACHSTAAKKQRGGLLLDSRAALLKGGDSGPAAAPGKPEASLLIRAIGYQDENLQMPPKSKLTERDVAVFTEWVRRGLPYPEAKTTTVERRVIDIAEGKKFWAFQPLQNVSAPITREPKWGRNRIDAFILADLDKHKLAPSPEADRRTLIRRLTFDLIGLAPTIEEVERFAKEAKPQAEEALVERLLASPRYGERWARFWLDLARYCDVPEEWAKKKSQPYLYRDWVVSALNEDMPYDRFVTLQLAADQVKGARRSDLAALGFLGLSPSYWKELKLAPEVIKTVVADEWEERIDTMASTFLGLTVACARCHDHKFDPITQHDYYGLAGVLASIREKDVRIGPGDMMAPGIEDASLHVLPDGPHKTKLDYRPGEAQDVALQVRGNPSNPGPIVPRRFLSVLSPESPRPFKNGSGRLDLAQAILNESTPLAARVIVNRVWAHHFGTGLVDTPSNFGTEGSRPSHPQLLDDLARRFVAAGWSLKWLHREIVLSSTYRQTSARDPNRQSIDPDNRRLWRMNRRRLEVEAWRDAMLQVSGSLDNRVGGAPLDLGDMKNNRRTLYGNVKRRELNDVLRLHDFPDPTTHSASRLPTTTALQQLFVLNSAFMQQQSTALAKRLLAERKTDEERIRFAYSLMFGRSVREGELKLALSFVGNKGDVALWTQYAQVLLGSNEFLFVD